MTDARDAVADARARIKKVAASMLARKESLERELAKLRAQRAEALERGAQVGGDDDDGAYDSDLAAIVAELEVLINAKEEQLALAERDLKAALEEMKDLERVGDNAERATLRAVVDSARGGDPLIRSPVETALDNVRAHAAELDARADLGDALAGERRPTAREQRETAEANARAQLAELKAKRQREREGKDDDDPDPTGKPKRTL